jgi:hypothetical protein
VCSFCHPFAITARTKGLRRLQCLSNARFTARHGPNFHRWLKKYYRNQHYDVGDGFAETDRRSLPAASSRSEDRGG